MISQIKDSEGRWLRITKGEVSVIVSGTKLRGFCALPKRFGVKVDLVGEHVIVTWGECGKALLHTAHRPDWVEHKGHKRCRFHRSTYCKTCPKHVPVTQHDAEIVLT